MISEMLWSPLPVPRKDHLNQHHFVIEIPCLVCSWIPPIMSSPDKVASVLFSFLLEDSFPQTSHTANEAYCFLSCPHWTWKIVCSSPFLFAALHTEDCSQVSSQPFSLNNLFILSFPLCQVFWTSDAFPLLPLGLSPFGSICEVQSPNGAEYFSWALSHAEKGKHLTFLCASRSYICICHSST